MGIGTHRDIDESPREEKDDLLQYSGLANSMDYIVHGVTKSQTRLRDFHIYLKEG